MFSHKNKKYSLRKVKNGVASVVIALLFASVTAPVAQAQSDGVGFHPDRETATVVGTGYNGLRLDGRVDITSIGGSGGSRGSEHDKDGCPRPWGTVGDPAGEICSGGSQGESGRDPRLGGTTDRNSLPGSQGENG
uniref:YSIRK-type signal peptide-containing protein n=2 Tax=Streptococcus TaxID=1301 RepID=UPI0012DE1BB0